MKETLIAIIILSIFVAGLILGHKRGFDDGLNHAFECFEYINLETLLGCLSGEIEVFSETPLGKALNQ